MPGIPPCRVWLKEVAWGLRRASETRCASGGSANPRYAAAVTWFAARAAPAWIQPVRGKALRDSLRG
jgi:hypothetical protein